MSSVGKGVCYVIMQVCKCDSVLCDYANVQVCECDSMTCYYASVTVCYVIMQVFKCDSMQVYKCGIMLCNYVSRKVGLFPRSGVHLNSVRQSVEHCG